MTVIPYRDSWNCFKPTVGSSWEEGTVTLWMQLIYYDFFNVWASGSSKPFTVWNIHRLPTVSYVREDEIGGIPVWELRLDRPVGKPSGIICCFWVAQNSDSCFCEWSNCSSAALASPKPWGLGSPDTPSHLGRVCGLCFLIIPRANTGPCYGSEDLNFSNVDILTSAGSVRGSSVCN